MKKIIILILAMVLLLLAACRADDSLPSGRSTNHLSSDNIVQPDSSGTQSNSSMQNEAPVVENSRIIKAVISKNCNYIYHMMAVSSCGYVNWYGNTYKSLHSEKDLLTLKKYEQLLTVEGGKHQGELYFLCVILPASLDDEISVTTYFQALADLFATGEIERNFKAYQKVYEQSFSSVAEVSLDGFWEFYRANEPLKNEIAEIAAVMQSNYGIYSDKVWETSLTELTLVTDELNKEFSSTDYVAKWEEVLDFEYGQEVFFALMCNSMENGPNCINISDDKDVFYHSGEYASTARLISHEFGIYLLLELLADTKAFQDYTYYGLTEALAEYYNTVVSGGHSKWDWGTEYIDFYKQLRDCKPEITAREMFLCAVDNFMPALAE